MRPEPECPPHDAPDAIYNAWLSDHAAWTREKAAEAPQKAPRKPTAPQYAEPEDLGQELALPFPVAVLPDELRRWALATAEFNQVPVSMAAIFAVMAAMTAAVRARVKIADGWVEPVVSQMMLIASPSERKSPVFKSAFAPVYEWGKREKRRAFERRGQLQRQIDAELTDEKGEAKPLAKGSPEEKRVAELQQQMKDIKPPRRRIADDITPEEFMRQMDDNDGTMCLVSDEADVFQSFGGRYSNGEPKLGPLLKGWDSSSPLMYDRVGGGGGKQRVNILIEHPRAGIAIAGQYTILDVLKKNPVYREKGMLARLMYAVLPERKGRRNLTPMVIERATQSSYAEAILRLFELDGDEPLELSNCVEFGNGWLQPKWLMAVRERVEMGILADGEFSALRDWAGKLVSNLARIAVVLEHMGGGGDENLAAMAEFFIAHAKRALHGDTAAPKSGTVLDEFSKLVEKLTKRFPPKPVSADEAVTTSRRFTMKELLQTVRMKKAEFEPVCEQLIISGHLQEVENERINHVGDRQFSRLFVLISKVGGAPPAHHPDDMPNGMPPPPAPDVMVFGDGDDMGDWIPEVD